jgi:cell division protein FtsZ
VFTFPTSRAPAAAPSHAPAAAPTPRAPIAEAPVEQPQDDDGDELVLESDDILTSPVMANPIAPPADDDATLHGNPGTDEPRAPRESGTLFERMSNIARGSAQARAEDDQAAPGFRREPLDIPGFLNRQNNR